MSVPFLDLQAQYRSLKPEIDAAMQAVLDTSTYALGPSVERFEHAFASFCGVEHCVAVNSGTAAISLLLRAHGIGDGDEVITVTNSFFASAEAISNIGATPILVDCTEDSALLDPALLEAAITPKTRAILPVHLYGQCADMDAITRIAKTHHLLVFEDACQAHGATYQDRMAGNLADGAAFSFYPGKNLGAYGEGGAVTTNNPEIARTIRMLREHGSEQRYHHTLVGWNERMDGLQGAVLGAKLPHLSSWNAARRAHAQSYRKLLPDSVQCITEHSSGNSVYHLFVIRTEKRDALQAYLLERGIQTGIHYPIPIHLQAAYEGKWQRGAFPIAERLAGEILSLPMYPELTEAQIQEVCDAASSFFKS